MGFEMDTAVSLVLADARRLKQILVNLLSNAIKFTPDGGQIGLEVHGDSENRILSFAVWDTGIGIRQEDLARLFRPFTQLDASTTRAAQGTGLGLALVSQMARLHGGGVTVESEPGQGSRFIVSIPWLAVPEADAPDSAEERTEAAPPPPQTAGPDLPPATGDRRPKVLLVDDTEAGRSLVRDYLGARGYRVLTAGDGFDGVAQAAEDRPDIILMDVMMPGLDGIETTRRMRNVAELEHTPIIALTALAMPGDRERCLAAGMNDYLSKPVKLAQLAQVIERQLAASADAAPAAV
jgi:CheY-like chemotaxis protein